MKKSKYQQHFHCGGAYFNVDTQRCGPYLRPGLNRGNTVPINNGQKGLTKNIKVFIIIKFIKDQRMAS